MSDADDLRGLLRERARRRMARDSGEPVEAVRARCRGYLEAAFGDDLDLALSLDDADAPADKSETA